MAYLEELEGKYGPLPSILATRADFLMDYERKEALLTRAYSAAAQLGDHKNLVHVSHSLTELYVETLVDVEQARTWLDRLDAHLIDFPDKTYEDDAQTFRQKLQRLDSPIRPS